MQAANHSHEVQSSQADIHPRLASVIDRYRTSHWDNPLHAATCKAFESVQEEVEGQGLSLILDSGCGTGESTRGLARLFPEALVIGVDKSADRLSRLGSDDFPFRDGNAIWLRAELASFWRLALQADWRLERHYLFYPNPWPKPGQLQRRWHAHPVFPDLLRLGGRLEMRTNWKVYADEFSFSVNRLKGTAVEPLRIDAEEPVSPFERKYRDSGHALWSVVAFLSNGSKL